MKVKVNNVKSIELSEEFVNTWIDFIWANWEGRISLLECKNGNYINSYFQFDMKTEVYGGNNDEFIALLCLLVYTMDLKGSREWIIIKECLKEALRVVE